jgi:hypothetical protein
MTRTPFTGASPESLSSTRQQLYRSPDIDKVAAAEDSVTGEACVGHGETCYSIGCGSVIKEMRTAMK